jgi:hypothetical protein
MKASGSHSFIPFTARIAMDDLAERIKAALGNRNCDPWYPELTVDLAAKAWYSLHRNIGLTPDSYGTERVLSHSISAPRKIITSLSTSALAGVPRIAIESLTQECALNYQEKGVSFYSRAEILNTSVLACIEDALAIINQVPSLMGTVSALVRSLHLIKPEYIDYDSSFSEPHVPFSIFVSVPEERTKNDALRVAEAIVHEAMHLQLTLIEYVGCLVNSAEGRYFSPWRREHRKAGSILHGIYVFYVIHSFLGRLASISSCPVNWLRHIKLRRREIRTQLDEMHTFQNCAELTAAGSILVRMCVEDSTSSRQPSDKTLSTFRPLSFR